MPSRFFRVRFTWSLFMLQKDTKHLYSQIILFVGLFWDILFIPGQQNKVLAVNVGNKIINTSTVRWIMSDTNREASENSSCSSSWFSSFEVSTSSDIFRVKWTNINANKTIDAILYLRSIVIASLWLRSHFRELAVNDIQLETPIKTIMNIGKTVNTKMNIV